MPPGPSSPASRQAERVSTEFNDTIDAYVDPPFSTETDAEHAARVGATGAGRAHDGSVRTMIGGPIEHQMQVGVMDGSTLSLFSLQALGDDKSYPADLTPAALVAVPDGSGSWTTRRCSG